MHAAHRTAPSLELTALVLAAAQLALPQAARAQTLLLGSGDALTVDGTGTHGAYGGDPAYSSTTTSYGSTSTNITVETTGTSAFTLGPGGSLTAGLYGLAMYANGSGPVAVTGGSLTAGVAGFGLLALGSGPVAVTGGSFAAGQSGYALCADTDASVTVTGGTFTTGVGGEDLEVFGTMDLYGIFTDPSGQALTPGQAETLPLGTSGSFIGTLEDNPAGQTFTFLDHGTLTLHEVAPAPEPSQTAALGVGVLGLAGLALKARRRKAPTA